MIISVTGAGGFIGSHLVKRLKKDGHNVLEWDRKSGTDVKDFELMGAEFVVHLAAIANVRRSRQYPWEYWENNVINTKNIQTLCAANQVPLVYASSSCVHNWFLSPYGMSKIANEATAINNPYSQSKQVGLRFTTVYGPGARDDMFMGRLKNGTLQYATDHIRDFIHVNDIINAIMVFVDTGTGDKLPAYNVGTGVGVNVSDLARMAGYDVPVRDGDDCEALNNTAQNQDLVKLGWKPNYDVRDWVKNECRKPISKQESFFETD